MASPLHPLVVPSNSLVASYSGGKGTSIFSHSSEKRDQRRLSPSQTTVNLREPL
uniref:Uncharacterized protein n=1 Tax=Solanum tuberosum TaxID=4113 RepID=M1CKZ7_SOLTU